MNKRYNKCWIIPVLLCSYHSIFSQNFRIQVGAFTEAITPSFFQYASLEKVDYQLSEYNFHHYYWGNYATAKSAQLALDNFKNHPSLKEFQNLKIVPATNQTNKELEGTINKNIDPQESDFQLFSRHISFQSPKLSLQDSEVKMLEGIAHILTKNPDLKLRIFAHKKANLQPKADIPADLIEHFLLAQNIPAYRIKIIHPPLDQPNTQKQQVIMTLVDLKEEIVLDKFGPNSLIVKQVIGNPASDVLE